MFTLTRLPFSKTNSASLIFDSGFMFSKIFVDPVIMNFLPSLE